jgi:hypothetical protein
VGIGTGLACLLSRRVVSPVPWPRSGYHRLRSRYYWWLWGPAELLFGAGCLMWGVPWVVGAPGVGKAWCLFAGFAAWALGFVVRYQADRARG